MIQTKVHQDRDKTETKAGRVRDETKTGAKQEVDGVGNCTLTPMRRVNA